MSGVDGRLVKLSLEDRFWGKVDKSGECWVWTAGRDPKGYGRIFLEGRAQIAHRVAWRLSFGAIPDGLFVCHHCDNPPCVRPSHLFLGTNADNSADRDRKGRTNNSTAGEANVNARLTAAQVRLIRESTKSERELGREFGVKGAAIGKARRRETWRHV